MAALSGCSIRWRRRSAGDTLDFLAKKIEQKRDKAAEHDSKVLSVFTSTWRDGVPVVHDVVFSQCIRNEKTAKLPF